eukprot:428837-Amphidinium_carterae.1
MFKWSAPAAKTGKAELRFQKGLFVGKHYATNEFLMMTHAGVFPSRTVKRLPMELQVDGALVLAARGLPWDATPARPARMAPMPARAVPIEEGVTTTERNLGTGRDGTVVLAQPSASELLPQPMSLPEEVAETMHDDDEVAVPKRRREESQDQEDAQPTGAQKRPAETPLAVLADEAEAEKERMVAAVETGKDELHEMEEQVIGEDIDELLEGQETSEADLEEQEQAKRKELENMWEKFGVFHLEDPSALTSDYKRLTCRWVIQKRGAAWRCRIVAREFKFQDLERAGLFTVGATVTCGRLVNLWATKNKMAKVYIILLPEIVDWLRDEKGIDASGKVGVLDRKLYGERDGSVAFGDLYASTLTDGGFERNSCQPQFYLHREWDVVAEVHRDDIHAAGTPQGLHYLRECVSKSVAMKWSEVMQPGEKEVKYQFLKNFFVLVPGGSFIQPHPKYAEDILKSLGMTDCAPQPTPITSQRLPEDADDPLGPEEAKVYRHCVSVCRFLRNYRPDLDFAVKELRHALQSPSAADMRRLKRLARYLKHSEYFGVWTDEREPISEVNIYSVDTDWAGDRVNRKSTSSCHVFVGGALLYDSSKLQSIHALSSGEAELYGAVGATCPAILIGRVLSWMVNRELPLVLHVDSKVAKAMIERQGVGAVRHLAVKALWLQAMCKRGELMVKKVPGEFNSSDVGTKVLAAPRFCALLNRMGVKIMNATAVPEMQIKELRV